MGERASYSECSCQTRERTSFRYTHKKKEGITVISFALVGSIYLFIFDNMLIAEGAEGKIDWPPKDYVKAPGSSIHPSFKNSSKDIIVPDKNVQGSSEGPTQQFPFTFFTVASLQQHTNSFSDQNLIRETCFGKIYLADHPGSKVTVPAKAPVLMTCSQFLQC